MASMDLSKLLEAQIKEQARGLIEPFITEMEKHLNGLIDKWDDTAEQLIDSLASPDKPKRKRVARKSTPAAVAAGAEAPGTRPASAEAVEAVKIFAIGDRVQAKQGRGTFQGTVKATVPETGEVSIEKDGGAGLVLRYAHRVEKLMNGAAQAVPAQPTAPSAPSAPVPEATPVQAVPAQPAPTPVTQPAQPAPVTPNVEHAATPASPPNSEASTPSDKAGATASA